MGEKCKTCEGRGYETVMGVEEAGVKVKRLREEVKVWKEAYVAQKKLNVMYRTQMPSEVVLNRVRKAEEAIKLIGEKGAE